MRVEVFNVIFKGMVFIKGRIVCCGKLGYIKKRKIFFFVYSIFKLC